MAPRLERPQTQVRLGTPDDPGSVHGLAAAGPALLVAHYGASGWGKLHMLHPRTLEPVADPLPVGHMPRAVAWHQPRNQAYVMNWGEESRSITRCDLATGRMEEIPVGFGLLHIAVDPVADRIYAADWPHRRLIVIDATDPSQRHTIDLPAPPTRIAVAADGDVMAALCLRSDQEPIDALAVIGPDGSVRTAAMTPAHLQPNAVAVAHDGMVYVGSLGGGGVHPLVGAHDPGTGERLGSAGTARGVRDLAAHPHLSRAWMATDDGAQLADLTDPYNPLVLDVVKTGNGPYGVTVGEDGTAYVGDTRDGTVSLIEPTLSDVPLEAVANLLRQAGHQGTLSQALRSYQTYHELPVTAAPDTTTVGHLTSPGCGTPDAVLPAGFNTYDGRHYRYTNITYYLGDMHMPIGHPEFTLELKIQLLENAFTEWFKILFAGWTQAPTLTRVFDAEKADLVISVGDHPDFDTGLFRTVFAVTEFPGDLNPWKKKPTKLPIIFNRDIRWIAPGYLDPLPPDNSGADFVYVATHEIGHALGLAHGSKKALMARNATWYRIPKTDDINGFRSLYGRMPFFAPRGMEALPGQNHLAYRDCEGHLLVNHPDGDGWAFVQLTAGVPGAPRMAERSAHSPFHAADGVPSYVYRGEDDHIHQLWWNGASWAWADLCAASGAPPGIETPSAYRNGATQRVVYQTADGRVIRLSQRPGLPWQWEDITQPGASRPLDSGLFPYLNRDTGWEFVTYTDEGDELRMLQEGPDGWSQLSLHQATQDEKPLLVADSPICAAARPGEEHRLFFIDHIQNIRMFFQGSDGVWHTRDLSAELGLPHARFLAMHRVPVGSELTWSLVWGGYDDDIQILRSAGDGWVSETIALPRMPATRDGYSVWLSQTERHIAFRGVDGNAHLLSRPLADPAAEWRLENVSRTSGSV
ncbi:matrixin family metalloprotease [Spirillospora albida]|uniref:matrixin family metalloprotease n=1 Tax=Spirillospora albida TaxID=58123 RepID=UPI0012F9A375|nr:matrixin family metalloprotease [Spirillospora albida]